MLTALAAFTVAGLGTGAAFLASYAAENDLPSELPAVRLPRLHLTPVPARPVALDPVWCVAARRWRHPVTRAFVKAPASR